MNLSEPLVESGEFTAAEAKLVDLKRAVALAKPEQKLTVFCEWAMQLRELIRLGLLNSADVVDVLYETIEANDDLRFDADRNDRSDVLQNVIAQVVDTLPVLDMINGHAPGQTASRPII